VILHHSTHTHDLGSYQGADASFTPLTDHDANSYYDVILTATDSNGVSTSRTVSVYPQTINLTVASSPAGAPVSYAGVDHSAPFTTAAAVGFETSISAAGQFAAGGSTNAFNSWSDGGAQLHNLTIPAADTTLTATYSGSGSPVSAPVATGGVLSSVSAPDRNGPAVTFTAGATSIRRGRLTGSASDPSGVSKVQAALRPQGSARAGCRWWSARLRRPRRSAGSCRRPDWMTARLTQAGRSSKWTVSLGSTPRPGSYVLLLRAFDRLGNVSTKTADGRSQRTLRVRAAGKARR
jgi:hypothetical protein